MRLVIPTAALFAAICLPSSVNASNLFLLMAGPLASGDTSTLPPNTTPTYPIVDTKQESCFSDLEAITCPVQATANFYGQDAHYAGLAPSLTDNGNETVTDNRTGLMWQKNPGDKKTQSEALAEVGSFSLAGYNDWRLPTIKELYSLILFNGKDASGCDDEGTECTAADYTPFLDTDYFTFQYGDVYGDRIIDAQYLSSNLAEGGTGPANAESAFGVNFADGRIKGYELKPGGEDNTFFVIYVRDISDEKKYGVNDFKDNGDSTVTDQASGLQWMQEDSKTGLNWQEALAYCENLSLVNHDDWRLPDAKELHSIVDYARAPDTNGTAAIDPVFSSTSITNEANQQDWPFYWTSTTLATWNDKGDKAVFVAFGRALGYMNNTWVNIHGAGAEKSDFKSGDPADYPTGHGPQNGAVRIDNYVRCVRNAD